MDLFETCTLIKQLLEADHDLWLMTNAEVRMFISQDSQKEGVFIDTVKKVISFPVSIRENTASVNFIFDKDALFLAINSEIPLSVLYEHKKLAAFGDPKNIFNASIFLTHLFTIASQVQDNGGQDIDSYSIH